MAPQPAVTLTAEERTILETFVHRGKANATSSAETLPGDSPRVMRASSWAALSYQKRLRRTDDLKEKGKAERFACFQDAVILGSLSHFIISLLTRL